jgi:hypothetical protein
MSITRFSVYFHELTHYLIAKLLLQPVKLTDIVIVNSNGFLRITPRNSSGLTFMQAIAIGLAPAFFSTIVIILIIRQIFAIWATNWAITIFLIILGISILQIATPSFMDLKQIFSSCYHRPFTAIRQLVIIGVSYVLHTEYQEWVANFLSFIGDPLFSEPFGLMGMIIVFELIISTFIIIIRYIFSKFIQTADFHSEVTISTIKADGKQFQSIFPSKLSLLSVDEAETDLCNNIQ